MRQTSRSPYFQIAGQRFRINNGPSLGCYCEVLTDLYYQLTNLLSHHSRLLSLRLDVKVYDYSEDNKLLSVFIRRLKRNLKSYFGFTRVGYLWVRELSKTGKQHYHLILLLDGSKVQHPKNVINIAEEIAYKCNMPVPYTPKNCYLKISRSNSDSFGAVMWRGSYMAKTRSKECNKKIRSFGSSNIKPRGN
jgi:hypothetical protein